MLESAVIFEYDPAHFSVVASQQRGDIFRFGAVRKRREAAQIQKNRGDFPPVVFEKVSFSHSSTAVAT